MEHSICQTANLLYNESTRLAIKQQAEQHVFHFKYSLKQDCQDRNCVFLPHCLFLTMLLDDEM